MNRVSRLYTYQITHTWNPYNDYNIICENYYANKTWEHDQGYAQSGGLISYLETWIPFEIIR